MSAVNLIARPNLFEYNDYRRFLRDLYHYLKSEHAYFSYRYFSKKAGFASPNFLKLVVEGQRNLSPDSTERFISALKLSHAEGEFFTQLVLFNQADSPSEKSLAAVKMLQSKNFQKIHPLTKAQFAYYAEWYYIPIREMVALKHFEENAEWVAGQMVPPIKADQAAKALKDLESLGLLVRDDNGLLVQAQGNVNTANEVVSSSLAKYHKKMISMAADSIDLIPRERREISAACIPISKETVPLLKAKIQEFRRELLALASQDTSTEVVYQVNLQMFPLTEWNSENEGNENE